MVAMVVHGRPTCHHCIWQSCRIQQVTLDRPRRHVLLPPHVESGRQHGRPIQELRRQIGPLADVCRASFAVLLLLEHRAHH